MDGRVRRLVRVLGDPIVWFAIACGFLALIAAWQGGVARDEELERICRPIDWPTGRGHRVGNGRDPASPDLPRELGDNARTIWSPHLGTPPPRFPAPGALTEGR